MFKLIKGKYYNLDYVYGIYPQFDDVKFKSSLNHIQSMLKEKQVSNDNFYVDLKVDIILHSEVHGKEILETISTSGNYILSLFENHTCFYEDYLNKLRDNLIKEAHIRIKNYIDYKG